MDEPIRLETPRLVLREVRAEDWPDARALDADPQVVRFQSNDVLDEAGTRKYLEELIAAAQASPRRVFGLAITLEGEDRLIGHVGLRMDRPEHREAMIWFNLRRDRWGQGIATEAVTGLIAFCFDRLGLHRVWGDCDPRNLASARVMEKLGMRREAHFRENWWLKGEWCDSWIYAVLEHEWRARRP